MQNKPTSKAQLLSMARRDKAYVNGFLAGANSATSKDGKFEDDLKSIENMRLEANKILLKKSIN